MKSWIKISDWREVLFPGICPYNGKRADSEKEHYIENTSIFWIVIRLLGIGEYITLKVPYHTESLAELKRFRRRAIWRGLGVGAIVAVLGFVGGVWIMVASNDPHSLMYRVGLMMGGIVFVFSLILGPVIAVSRVHQKASPVFFRKNGKELWVKIRDDGYRASFKSINDAHITEDLSDNEQVLDM